MPANPCVCTFMFEMIWENNCFLLFFGVKQIRKSSRFATIKLILFVTCDKVKDEECLSIRPPWDNHSSVISKDNCLGDKVEPCYENRNIIKWTATNEFGTYRLCEQRRFRRACASAQSRQNLRCSLIEAASQEKPSDRKPDPWPLWIAGHAQLKFVMTQCSKTQIRLTGLKWSDRELPSCFRETFPKLEWQYNHYITEKGDDWSFTKSVQICIVRSYYFSPFRHSLYPGYDQWMAGHSLNLYKFVLSVATISVPSDILFTPGTTNG